jgi:hypothetical protein
MVYMKNSQKLLTHSFGHALLVVLYTSGIASVMFNSKTLFKQQDTVFAPIAILMLFVLSAAIVGALVLGRPILLYLEGKKSEALKMFGYTLGWLALSTFVFFLLNLK